MKINHRKKGVAALLPTTAMSTEEKITPTTDPIPEAGAQTKPAKKAKDLEKKKRRRKRARRVLLAILCLIILFVGVTTVITVVSIRAHIKEARSFSPVEIPDRITPVQDEDGNWTYTTDREFKILQLTDVHIGGGWMCMKKDSLALNTVAAMVTAEKPDLVIITGDVSYPVPFQAGTFNNKSGARIFANLMDQLGVDWTLAFGNHDTEAYSYFDRGDLSEFYEGDEWEHCLFRSGPEGVDGSGNQIINIKNSAGYITQSLYLIDSHSYTDNDWLGIMWKYDNIHESQIEWYKENVEKMNLKNAQNAVARGETVPADPVKSLAFFHIPPEEMRMAYNEFADNGFRNTDNVKFVYGFAGESKKVVYCGIHSDNFVETALDLGSTQGMFFGHDHYNNISFDYKRPGDTNSICLTYGMSVDYLAYPGILKNGAQRGCTVITVSPDGSFAYHQENYYQDKYTAQYDKEDVTMQDVPDYVTAVQPSDTPTAPAQGDVTPTADEPTAAVPAGEPAAEDPAAEATTEPEAPFKDTQPQADTLAPVSDDVSIQEVPNG